MRIGGWTNGWMNKKNIVGDGEDEGGRMDAAERLDERGEHAEMKRDGASVLMDGWKNMDQ